MIEKKYYNYLYEQASSSSCKPAATPPPSASPAPCSPEPESVPKRQCTTPGSTGITLQLPRDILKKVGPTADRLGVSNNQLTVLIAAITNHGGGDIDAIALSKSTCRRSRISARTTEAEDTRNKLQCIYGQVNFDGMLLHDLGGFEKINRLAVVLVQEEENQILGIVQTDDSTDKYIY